MRQAALLCTITIAVSLIAGCGGSSGIETGIPSDLKVSNPTPDMDPHPETAGKTLPGGPTSKNPTSDMDPAPRRR